MCKGGFLHMQRIKDFGLIKNVFWRKQKTDVSIKKWKKINILVENVKINGMIRVKTGEIVRNNEKNLVKLTKMYCIIATPIL